MTDTDFHRKAAIAAGAMAAAAAPAAANAALVTVNGPGSSHMVSMSLFGLTSGDTASWDVDGTGNPEFRLEFLGSTLGNFGNVFLASAADAQDIGAPAFNGRGFVNAASTGEDEVARLNSSFMIGATLPAGYFWGQTQVRDRTMMSYNRPALNIAVPGVDAPGFSPNSTISNMFAFAFDAGSGLQYGWANISFFGQTLFITEWTYSDTPGESVHVGSREGNVSNIPVPASAVPALTLLGLGAAGLRTMRKRQGHKLQG